MSVEIFNMENYNRVVVEEMENFKVIECQKDTSVAPENATREYFMGQMHVRRRQIVIELDDDHSAILQSGAMQWIVGDVEATTGIKGVGDFFGKKIKGSLTNETTIKPEYRGNGVIVLEPTYKYIILQDIGDWSKDGGMVMEDGMFLACDGDIENKVAMRKSISSAALGNEGLFNLYLKGDGVAALESNVPQDELIEVYLDDDVLKLDGNFAICWSKSLNFTVERSSKSLAGSAMNGEGLLNVYRGTGRVLLSPVALTDCLYHSTHNPTPPGQPPRHEGR